MASSKEEITKVGLSLLTAAHLDQDRPAPEVFELIRDGMAGDPDYAADAIVGLLNVATILLVKLEAATNRPARSFLSEIGEQLERRSP